MKKFSRIIFIFIIFSLFSCSTGKKSVPEESDGGKSDTVKNEKPAEKPESAETGIPEENDINKAESQNSSTAALEEADTNADDDSAVLKDNTAAEADSLLENNDEALKMSADNTETGEAEAGEASENSLDAEASENSEETSSDADKAEGSLPVEDGTGRTSGTGWAKKSAEQLICRMQKRIITKLKCLMKVP